MNIKISEKAKAELLANHFPDPSVLDCLFNSLHRAKALADFICDVATLAQNSQFPEIVGHEGMESIAEAVVLNIKDAEILISDYLKQKRTGEHGAAMSDENNQAELQDSEAKP